MSNAGLGFLASELTSVSSETRRKYPDVREAADKASSILRAQANQSPAILTKDGPESEDILRPLIMGCGTRNAKVVIMCLGSLHRLITLKYIPVSAVPTIISTLGECVSQGVDVQLRILQILLSLLTNYPTTHGELLGDALLLCFKLQDSRIAVVSSTASATLRQLVMLVFDKVVDGDRKLRAEHDVEPNLPVTLPDGQTVTLPPFVKDAYSVLEDLCLLANLEHPRFLRLDTIPKTFPLELIESVLTNYHQLFRQRSELLLLLQHHLCPSLLKSLSDKPFFPLTLRSIRVVFLLLKQFIKELETEGEVFLSIIVKVIAGDHEAGEPARPLWMRVLAMEIMRGLCSDVDIVRAMWDQYDSQKSSSKVFTSLVTALKRLAMEKPSLLGVETQMFGIGVSNPDASIYGIDVAAVSTMVVSSAASMVGIAGSGAGLSVTGSSMKLQCIDQLDKADPPPIPDPYVYLLALQCITSLTNALATLTIPLYTSLAVKRPRSPGESVMRAPPALDITSLDPATDPGGVQQLKTAFGMLESVWPAMLAALSFFITTSLSEELFADVLTSIQNMTNTAGALGLSTPRDAFLTCLVKFAIPPGVVSSLDAPNDSTTQKGGVLSAENLGLTSLTGGAQAPSLSERNVACLKVLLSSALFLAGSLGASWFSVLEALQNADYVLFTKATSAAMGRRVSTGQAAFAAGAKSRLSGAPANSSLPGLSGSQLSSSTSRDAAPAARPPVMQDLEASDVQTLLTRLFDASKNLDDEAFQQFVGALCRLSSEMVGMQAANRGLDEEGGGDDPGSSHSSMLSPPLTPGGLGSGKEGMHRRRASGIQLARAPSRSGDYAIAKLGTVSRLNMHRLIYRDPTLVWNTVTGHLLSVIRNSLAPGSIRMQAAEVLDSILAVAPKNLTTASESQAETQLRVLDVLSQQVIFETHSTAGAVATDIRRLGLETLHEIIQISGHALVDGWKIVFDMLASVCQSRRPSLFQIPSASSSTSTGTLKPRPPPLQPIGKGNAALTRIAFQSLTLVCDSVNSLSPTDLRRLITTIALFAQQNDTNMALTSTESLLWGVSDSLQSKRLVAENEATYSELWMFLLGEVRGLCTDERSDVRNGAIQTLFRSLQLYGASISESMWTESLDVIIFPLLDSFSNASKGDDAREIRDAGDWGTSKSLVYQLIGSTLSTFMATKILPLPSFTQSWDKWTTHVTNTSLYDLRSVSASSLNSLESTIAASGRVEGDLKEIVVAAWERTWVALDTIGTAVDNQEPRPAEADAVASAIPPFSQDSLLALTGALQTLHSLAGAAWDLERLQALLQHLKGILTYAKSPEYRHDIDALSPVQAAVCDTVEGLELVEVAGLPSAVLTDIADYATLAYYGSFDVTPPAPKAGDTSKLPSTAPKRVTYIALSKRTMPRVVELCHLFKDRIDVFNDASMEHVISALATPIKLRYDCPAPSKFGSDTALWKTATTSFIEIVTSLSASVTNFGEELTDERVDGIWRQVVETIRGSLLADCSILDTMPIEQQDAEERFDRNLLVSIEKDVVPYLGDLRVGDEVTLQLAKSLQFASKLHQVDETPFAIPAPPPEPSPKKISKKKQKESVSLEGTTAPSRVLPRERFSYWCFDLLFSISANTSERGKRVAALSIPSLLLRCHGVLTSYIVDEALRGNVPFPRIREEELLYVLAKLRDLRIWSGALWAAFSDNPTESSANIPPIDATLPPAKLIEDATRRSSQAHLFHFYTPLYEIATVPRTPASAWIVAGSNGFPPTPPASRNGHHRTSSALPPDAETAVEVDSRQLAKECLRQIGKEIGAEI